jgi:flagellar basal-body rod protein FlgB
MQVGFLNFYGAVLDVAQQRATLVANNIANADTPGFKAQDVPFNVSIPGVGCGRWERAAVSS